MPNPLKDVGLSLEQLKLVPESRGIRGYETMSEDKLLKTNKKGKKKQKKVLLKQK